MRIELRWEIWDRVEKVCHEEQDMSNVDMLIAARLLYRDPRAGRVGNNFLKKLQNQQLV